MKEAALSCVNPSSQEIVKNRQADHLSMTLQ